MTPRNIYRNMSPLDYRYFDDDVANYLSEEAFVKYKLRVELALVETLAEREICPASVVAEVAQAITPITAEEVYAEEEVTHHDIRALVNCIQRRVSDESKPFVHMTATSMDIVSTAEAARNKDVMKKVVLPKLHDFIEVLANLAGREATTVQIARTHGQHAVPITFGFTIMEYVFRLWDSAQRLNNLSNELTGKFSGAVGAYNASSLFINDPRTFEEEVLAKMGVQAPQYSTQIAPPEPMTRFICEVTMMTGIIANLADDMRNLQRTEIGEVGEEFLADQVGSSTMPQKQNPINFENSKSCWKIVMPRVVTVFMDQISEHQRDLTNSASSRTYGESIGYAVSMIKRMTRVMKKLVVNEKNLQRNFVMQGDLIAAEPLYLLLARQGHPDAHEKVKQLTLAAKSEGKTLSELLGSDEELKPYLEKMENKQREILAHPETYLGKSEDIASLSRHILNLLTAQRLLISEW